eukprot:scaffold1558_cov403-Prasinococcus_capsulatus_cf.AAC.38
MAMAPIPRENLSLGPSYQGGSSNSSSLQEFPQDFEQNLVPVEISWKQPSWKPLPESVFLESSFDGWSQRHELRRVNNEFTMLRLLAPGYGLAETAAFLSWVPCQKHNKLTLWLDPLGLAAGCTSSSS